MEIARGIEVPLHANSVDTPEVRYAMRGPGGTLVTCLIFTISDDENHVGRVIFEGLDSIRCARGEYPPYKDDCVARVNSRYPWVFEVDDSSWLQQRHTYENTHYKTPLLEEYIHYLFRFHDQFAEVIAKGIWFETIKYDQADIAPDADNPLMDLPECSPSEEFVVDGIRCLIRHNLLTQSQLIERSKLCSQVPFQYFLMLDGQPTPSYSAKLRTIRGKSMTRLRGGLFHKDLLASEGIVPEAHAREAFGRHVAEVAERRRRMGKSD